MTELEIDKEEDRLTTFDAAMLLKTTCLLLQSQSLLLIKDIFKPLEKETYESKSQMALARQPYF